MDEKLSKIKEQIIKIDALKGVSKWGPEYQLWERATEKLLKEVFGEEGLKLFKQQQTVTFSYIDEDYNWEQYFKELDKRKRILEGLLAEMEESQPKLDAEKKDKNILKEIWRKEQALKENLLTTKEAQDLHQGLLTHLNETLLSDSIPGLRFRKLQTGKPITWWSNKSGYPIDSSWSKFQPFLELLEQYEAEKTIKQRLETEGLFVESRSQGEDQHLLIGKRDGTDDKAHIIIDGRSGEIRTEDKRKEPTELVSHIETILTLPNGKKIRTTREVIEEMS